MNVKLFDNNNYFIVDNYFCEAYNKGMKVNALLSPGVESPALGHPKKSMTERTALNFWRHVDKSGDCWLWTGAIDKRGYGRFGFGGTSHTANRIAWILTNGDPGELFVCHSCHNPPCIRPSHMYLGTHAQNLRDSIKVDGHKRAKLTLDQVFEIRKRRASGEFVKDIAVSYGVAMQTIDRVVSGDTWKILAPLDAAPPTGRKLCKRGHRLSETRKVFSPGQTGCGVCRDAGYGKRAQH